MILSPRARKLQGMPGRSYTQKGRTRLKDQEDMSEDTEYGKTAPHWPNERCYEHQSSDRNEVDARDGRNPGVHSVNKFLDKILEF